MSAELPSYDGLMQPTRRHFLGTSALGLGVIVLAWLLWSLPWHAVNGDRRRVSDVLAAD